MVDQNPAGIPSARMSMRNDYDLVTIAFRKRCWRARPFRGS
jgi:hypothetical protein